MKFDFSSNQPLFQQVALQIEEAILNGAFPEGSQIPSTTEISKSFQINPATVLKGMNLLVDRQLIEKRRGIGMFVVNGAKETLQETKKEQFFTEEVTHLIKEAKELSITIDQLKELIERGYEN